jgi:hypothetical protein
MQPAHALLSSAAVAAGMATASALPGKSELLEQRVSILCMQSTDAAAYFEGSCGERGLRVALRPPARGLVRFPWFEAIKRSRGFDDAHGDRSHGGCGAAGRSSPREPSVRASRCCGSTRWWPSRCVHVG